ncbi:uncharacterized protein LOC112048174 isoform X1 [Bicyclus anynana]|uniref:Uncharacterized protein LOC112048174 isoform X1 n=1 Tax=Bicyclus anynana TaxID=110368 RepID=A0A6J1N8D6_BICAN|nr:uncharacterized protein LOC112048174 isoform X1 [Bicyclus anynana]XP_052742237.1 uncharacterized protein LOC112048174 isoform X1 [Bicyclus anynana]
MHQKVTGWTLLVLISSSAVLHTLAYPQPQALVSQATSNVRTQNLQYYSNSLPLPHREQIAEERKFAEKPNALKKVALDDLDDIQNNSISDGGFSWSNMLGMIMHMIFNPGGNGPNKSDNLDTDVGAPSTWASLVSMGFKILTAILGGGASNDGIDKVDNGNSPMQSILAAVLSTVLGAKDPDQVASMAKQAGEFINIVVNLLDALKTSLSHRSLTARSAGRKDSVSDAALAGIAMLKTYVRSFGTNDDKCLQKYVCDANSECSSDIGPKSVFCQLGTYAASFVLERQSSGSFDQFYEAGRRGRSGIDCRQLYLECNEV